MAKTKISDIIIPELFAPYVIVRTKELSNIITSGIARTSRQLDDFVSSGGKLINLPFWNPLGGDNEVLSDTTPLTPDKITAQQDVAVKLLRGKAWSANELASAIAGDSAMNAIATQVAQWWSIQEQKILIAVLNGIFAGALATSHVKDISLETGSKSLINAVTLLDTKQLLGDAAPMLTTMVVHSLTFTYLQKQNLIAYIPNARGEIEFPRYLGYRVVVDDGTPNDGTIFTTFLFADGAIARGDGMPTDLTLVELDRDALQGDDILVNRRALILHPSGVKFTNTTVAGASPSNAELALPANWQKVVDNKNIGIVALKHKLA